MIKIKLNELLEEMNVSQRELSRRTGIRQPTISEMCLNKSKALSVKNLDSICEELDCELTDIIEYIKGNPIH